MRESSPSKAPSLRVGPFQQWALGPERERGDIFELIIFGWYFVCLIMLLFQICKTQGVRL